MIRADNFVVIQGWMVTELKLKGLDLLIFAIIYSFSQGDDNFFIGSIGFLQEWTNASRRSVFRSLDSLVEDGFILKFVDDSSKVRKVSYCYNYRKIKR